MNSTKPIVAMLISAAESLLNENKNNINKIKNNKSNCITQFNFAMINALSLVFTFYQPIRIDSSSIEYNKLRHKKCSPTNLNEPI